MSGIDSLEYRLEQFLRGWREAIEPVPENDDASMRLRAEDERLARAIIHEFGKELAS